MAALNIQMISAKRGWQLVGGIGSGRSLHLGAADKVEHWRSIDLADLKHMGLLKPIVGARIRVITWERDDGGLDKFRHHSERKRHPVRQTSGRSSPSGAMAPRRDWRPRAAPH